MYLDRVPRQPSVQAQIRFYVRIFQSLPPLPYHTDSTFSRKHMDKHTRPYACQDPACNGLDFGDKAGLRRHEREKHGAVKFCCAVPNCPRHIKGFGRKANLDLHVQSRHRSVRTVVADGIANGAVEMNSESPEPFEDGAVDDEEAGNGVMKVSGNMDSLMAKLQESEAEKKELEAKRKELAESEAKVDADIQAIKRTMQLVSN